MNFDVVSSRKDGNEEARKILEGDGPYILLVPHSYELEEERTYCTWKGMCVHTQSLPEVWAVIKILRDAADMLEEEDSK